MVSSRVLLLGLLLVGCGDGEPSADVPGFVEVAIGSDVSQVTGLYFLPDSDELLLPTRVGTVEHHQLIRGGSRTRLIGSFEVPVHAETDCGLISLAFDPEFSSNGWIYLGHCTSLSHSAIGRVTFDPDDPVATAASYVTILELGHDDAEQPWHNVGALGFDDEGALLALFGDKTIPALAQDSTSPLGGIVRLFPSRSEDVGGYTLPDDPAYGSEGSPLLWAKGLRSPWTGFLDHEGRMIVGDVGQGAYEEVDVIQEPGANLGWPLHEGPCMESCEGFVDPVRSWNRSETHPFVLADPDAVLDWPRVVWVAPGVPPGLANPYDDALSGVVLYGDLCVGFVRVLELDSNGAVVRDEALGHLANATGWDVGPHGDLYAVTFADRCTTSPGASYGRSRLYRLLPTSTP